MSFLKLAFAARAMSEALNSAALIRFAFLSAFSVPRTHALLFEIREPGIVRLGQANLTCDTTSGGIGVVLDTGSGTGS